MNTKEMSGEQISALADGEVTGEQLDLALAALRKDEACADWEIYHQIGDLLRSDDMAVKMSPDFGARFAARLDAEPTIITPAASNMRHSANFDARQTECAEVTQKAGSRAAKRWALPGMVAAAAMASIAFVATPQLMVAFKGTPVTVENGNAVASTGNESLNPGSSTPVLAASASGEVIMRDARIDDYLFAHQRISPSLYSTAQYARSATFATESTK